MLHPSITDINKHLIHLLLQYHTLNMRNQWSTYHQHLNWQLLVNVQVCFHLQYATDLLLWLHSYVFYWICFRKELGLLAWLSGEPATLLIHQRIKQHVEHSCQSNFEVPYLFTLEEVFRCLYVIHQCIKVNILDTDMKAMISTLQLDKENIFLSTQQVDQLYVDQRRGRVVRA